jgi:Ca2+:H+ antiporter
LIWVFIGNLPAARLSGYRLAPARSFYRLRINCAAMATRTLPLPVWSILAPVAGWALFALAVVGLLGSAPDHPLRYLLVPGLVACALAAVYHAEVVAHRLGEPYGTLLLAIAVTVIEVALIVALMLAGGPATETLARDAVFAAVMLILNGIVGACLLIGGLRHREQEFGLYGVSASLATLAAIAVLTLVLPNYTETTPGPAYSPSQLGFIAIASLALYGTFLLVQAVRHRDYFLPAEAPGDEAAHAAPPSGPVALASAGLLLACLVAVVLLAKALAPAVEAAVLGAGAPKSVVGILIAALVLLPESVAALRAAHANRLQTSLNLALGSALASIGLTIPAVALVSLSTGWSLSLGLDAKSSVLLVLSLFIASLSLGTGRTTVLQGAVHLLVLGAYLFTTIVP